MSSIFTYAIIGFAIVLASAPVTGGGRGKLDTKQLKKLATRERLPLPDELQLPVVARIRQREKLSLSWGVGGLVVGAALGVTIDAIATTEVAPVGVMFGAAMGMTLGSWRAVIRDPGTFRRDAPRVARAQATEVSDYTTAAEMWAVRLVPVVVVISLLVMAGVWYFTPLRPAGGLLVPIAWTLAAVVLMGLCGWLVRMRNNVVERPQRAASDLELAWDDALRGAAIRDLQDSVVAAGMALSVGIGVSAMNWLLPHSVRDGNEQLTATIAVVGGVAILVCLVTLGIVWAAGRLTANPSRRLWAGKAFEVL